MFYLPPAVRPNPPVGFLIPNPVTSEANWFMKGSQEPDVWVEFSPMEISTVKFRHPVKPSFPSTSSSLRDSRHQ
jgi:hypothetical protein